MSHKVSIILGSHNHVPFGTGDEECEQIYTTRLKPFITALNQYPKIPAVLHYSGVLLHWLEGSHPEFSMLIGDLITRKQVEILGGGFYEPMMPLLPQADKIGQIEMLTTHLRKKFGKRPQGCWIPGIAWEQSMVGALNTCGMGYTFLEEGHFKSAGLSEEGCSFPCISENQGKLLIVFPYSLRLQAEFAQREASLVLKDLVKAVPLGEERLISIFPEQIFAGSGSSEAPERTYRHFFDALSRAMEDGGDVKLVTPGRIFKSLRGLKKAYFPGEPERHFLITYPEANGIYSKMIFTHVLINQLRGDKSRKHTAREELWKSQGYDVFCHPGDGGIYRNTTRKAVYRALLGAEKMSRDNGRFIPSLMAFDFDLDGREEYLFQDRDINCYVKTGGASVFEFDYLPRTWNYLDTLARRRESYITGPLVEDECQRAAFADRLAPLQFSLEDAREGRFAGTRFCGKEQYGLVDMDRLHGKARFRLPVNNNLPFGKIELEKEYRLKNDTLTVRYVLTNRGFMEESFKFIPQIDFAFAGEGLAFQGIFKLTAQGRLEAGCEEGELADLEGIEFRDIKNEVSLSLRSGFPFDGWILPIRTRCRINGLITDQYQSTCLMPVQPVSLVPGGIWETEFRLRVFS
ncbi:MAG: DUF1926 domain-containing protein [Treponema sp.]|jgi:hypothetical protein|nr:DUF1926 domain-containing protein [Treponema sp.]